MKTAIIYGITGQDGFYLTQELLRHDYKVVGVTRRSSVSNTTRLTPFFTNKNLELVEGDVTDCFSIANLISKYRPNEIYNLAAQSHVATSFNQPALTWDITAGGCLNILEAIRNMDRSIKFYQASSSEMFGCNYDWDDGRKYQDEETPMMPQSPYAIAKLAAHHLVRNYRDSYDIFACSGILFNHESPMRGEKFVTRKITKWIGEFKQWLIDKPIFDQGQLRTVDDPNKFYANPYDNEGFPKLRLGNIEARRDWGHAADYCRAMYLMLQQNKPDDYVVSTQETHSVKEFLELAFKVAHLGDYTNFIIIDPDFYRPAEVDYLLGDSSKARQVLNWSPKYDFQSLVEEMVEYDLYESEKRRFGTKEISSR
jgi:GDPmannose 4,6-dehydratase